MTNELSVNVIAHTVLVKVPETVGGTAFGERLESNLESSIETDIDLLAEIAGRECYKAYEMKNPNTVENEGYINSILDHKHFSVTEHGTVTFHVRHASRALLLELERHRHGSFSVESQRYVNTRKYHPDPVIPPAFREEGMEETEKALVEHYHKSLDLYDKAYKSARDGGLMVKEAREAARAFLLESTPVDFYYSGNMRAMRDMLGKRWSSHADAEIREFAGKILAELKEIAPNTFQDFSDTPID